MARVRVTELRRRVYQVLEQGPVGDAMGVVIDRLLVLLILLNLVAVALESVPEYGARYALAFNLIEIVSLVVFTVEYGLRLWVRIVRFFKIARYSPAMRSRLDGLYRERIAGE